MRWPGVAIGTSRANEAIMRSRFIRRLAAGTVALILTLPSHLVAQEATDAVECAPGSPCPPEGTQPQEAQVGAGTTAETTTGTSGPGDDEEDRGGGAGEAETDR